MWDKNSKNISLPSNPKKMQLDIQEENTLTQYRMTWRFQNFETCNGENVQASKMPLYIQSTFPVNGFLFWYFLSKTDRQRQSYAKMNEWSSADSLIHKGKAGWLHSEKRVPKQCPWGAIATNSVLFIFLNMIMKEKKFYSGQDRQRTDTRHTWTVSNPGLVESRLWPTTSLCETL